MKIPFKQVNFDPVEHKYTDNAGRIYTSVTTLLSEDDPFDAEAIASKVIVNERSKYYGMKKADVLRKWAEAAPAGTRVHEAVEDYINKQIIPEDDLTPLVAQFSKLNFTGELLSEVVLHNEDLLIAGTADIIEMAVDRSMCYLWDIKTSVSRPAGDRVDDTKMHKFSLQLEMYKRLIERNFKIPCVIGGIVWFKDYINLRENTKLELFQVKNVEGEVDGILQKRRIQVIRDSIK